MLDSIILLVIAAMIAFGLLLLWFIFDLLKTIDMRVDSMELQSYKDKESIAESALADDGEVKGFDKDGKIIEESLYRNKECKYSYKVYDENKKRREKEKNPDDYIDDFEQAAEKLEKSERKSKYAR